jgi:hypothetical protein
MGGRRGKDKTKRKMNAKSLANMAPPIKKGEIRNPRGINRKRPWTDRMFSMTEEPLRITEEGELIRKSMHLPENATWGDAAVRRLMRECIKGSVAALREFADRIEGKAPERLEITGPERKEITIRLIQDRVKADNRTVVEEADENGNRNRS